MTEYQAGRDANDLLELKGLVTCFYTDDGTVHVVNGISYTLKEGETLGVVGESGCGKTVHALSIMRLIPSPPGKIEGGEVIFRGRDLLKISNREMPKSSISEERDAPDTVDDELRENGTGMQEQLIGKRAEP